MLGLAVAIAVTLSAGVVYGVMGQTQFQRGASAGSMMGGSGYGYASGMMGGSGCMMGGYGYGSGMMGTAQGSMGVMMAGYSGMMGNASAMAQCAQYMADYANHTNSSGTVDFVAIMNGGFYPSTLSVSKGATVTWMNMDFVQHTVTSGSEQAPTNLFYSH